jgi:hypothetical protein
MGIVQVKALSIVGECWSEKPEVYGSTPSLTTNPWKRKT